MSKSLRPAAQLLILTLSLAGPVLSHATLATNVPRGEKTVQVPVLGRNAERCMIPKHVANGMLTMISRTRANSAVSMKVRTPQYARKLTAQIRDWTSTHCLRV